MMWQKHHVWRITQLLDPVCSLPEHSLWMTVRFSVAVCLDIPQAIRDRCYKVTAAKYTNDLMHGLYTTAFMAAHSVTGLGSSRETQPSLPPEDVKKIVCEVKSVFPEKNDAEIKGFIRQK